MSPPTRLITSPTFEYLVEGPKSDETTQEWLNRRGREAWELVHIHVNAIVMGGALTGFFRRVTQAVVRPRVVR